MAHSDVEHDYHLVNPSPWPLVASISAFIMAVGAVIAMHGLAEPLAEGVEPTGLYSQFAQALLLKGDLVIFGVGTLGVLVTMFGWWGDVIKESIQGDHTPVVDIGLRYGMILFIASEVMFFVAWFWVFFEMAIFHNLRAEWYVPSWDAETAAAWASWPPPHVETFEPFHLPLLNTLILLTSGTTVTWAHHALLHNDRKGLIWGLTITVALGVLFSFVQAYEYIHAPFGFKDSIYGATFFMATGFHGFHVLVGTIFLLICLLRAMAGDFTPKQHFGFEAAAWYWHFVDVVWLFLFVCVYVWASSGATIAAGH